MFLLDSTGHTLKAFEFTTPQATVLKLVTVLLHALEYLHLELQLDTPTRLGVATDQTSNVPFYLFSPKVPDSNPPNQSVISPPVLISMCPSLGK